MKEKLVSGTNFIPIYENTIKELKEKIGVLLDENDKLNTLIKENNTRFAKTESEFIRKISALSDDLKQKVKYY